MYFNGKKLGKHIGGFTPFNFEITDLIKEKDNFIIVKVDNKRKKEAVPTLNTDWWNYGGLTRDVKLVEVQNTFIEDYFIQLDKDNAGIISGYIKLNGKNQANEKVNISIPELKLKETVQTNKDGIAKLSIPVKKVTFWDIDNPKLYQVEISANKDLIKDHIGFRSIKTEGSKVLLNNKPIFLKGISIHEESPVKGGRAHSLKDAETLLGYAKELGCNYVRLAHYPHNEHMLRLSLIHI